MLHPAVDMAVDALCVHPLLYLPLDAGQKFLVGGGPGRQGLFHLLIPYRVQILERGVLQLPLDALHTKAVGDGGVYLQRFQRLLPLFLGGLILHGPHIVQPVTDLDEDDPDVLGHGHEHLPQILHLLLFLGDILHPCQLGDPLHQIGHGGGELFGDLLVGDAGVLNDIVQQGGDDGIQVQFQLGHDLGYRQWVDDIRLPAFPQLPRVGVVGIGKGLEKFLGVHVGAVRFDVFLQGLIAL